MARKSAGERPGRPDPGWESISGGRWHPTFSGISTFLMREHTLEIDGADVVVTGVPFDNATTDRPGTRFGPRGLRAASAGISELKSFPYGFDPFATLRVVDAGDCQINHHLPETIISSIEAHADWIIGSGARMASLGGDHFITYPLLKAHARKHGAIALLQFDSHCDTWPDWTDRATSLNHGSMFLRAVNEGIIDVGHSIQVGLRTHNDSTHGFEILTAPWLHRNGVEAAVAEIKKRVGKAKVYLSFDIDFLDPAYAPGTGTPVAGGPATWQALEIIRGLAGLDIVGFDLVEVSPPYDHAEVTALAGATIVYELICLEALRKGAKRATIGRI
jgi:agmatinase